MFKVPRGLAVASFAISLLTLSATIVPEIAMAQSDKPAIRPDVEAFLKMFLARPRPPMSDEGVKMAA